MYGGNTEWNYLLEKLKVETDEKTARELVQALALTTNKKNIQKYLNMSLNLNIVGLKNFKLLINSMVTTTIGSNHVITFLKDNWALILKRYALVPFYMTHLIEWGFGHIMDEEVYVDTKVFLATHPLGSGVTAAQQVMNSVRYNIIWLKKNERDIVEWLMSNTS